MKSNTKWIDINEIQREYLPLSKKKIREIVKTNLDVTRAGNKLLVEREQLEAYLRQEM